MGLERDLGSLEVGKLGDLVVFESDPLVSIRNTATIQYVMKGGVLYDANSLDELWPRARKFGDYLWVVPDMYRDDDRPVDCSIAPGHDRRRPADSKLWSCIPNQACRRPPWLPSNRGGLAALSAPPVPEYFGNVPYPHPADPP